MARPSPAYRRHATTVLAYMQDHPHTSVAAIKALLGVTEQRCQQILSKMAREGFVCKGVVSKRAVGGWFGWRLTEYVGPPLVFRDVAECPARTRVLALARKQGYVLTRQAPENHLATLRRTGQLESPFQGVYVLPGTVPRLGVVLHKSLSTRLQIATLRNVELYGQTRYNDIVAETGASGPNVGAAAQRLRNIGIIEHPRRGKAQFTELGLRMLAEERKHNPPGVFTPLGSIDDL